jgi:hypothetical protein
LNFQFIYNGKKIISDRIKVILKGRLYLRGEPLLLIVSFFFPILFVLEELYFLLSTHVSKERILKTI